MPVAVLLVWMALVAPLAAQPSSTPAQANSAQAYYEFMLARRLESQGDEAGAVEALKRALARDPGSAELRAELAGLYARMNKGTDAVALAEEALKLDAQNLESHRILGLVFAAWSDGGVKPPPGRTQGELRAAAIDHLTKILDTPAIATDLSIQLTLARLHVRASHYDVAIPILENITSQSPYIIEPYTLLADAKLATGRPSEAAEALAMAAQLNPRHYVALGDLYERLGKWDEAAEAYGHAVESARGSSREIRLKWIAALLSIAGGQGAQKARDALTEYLAGSPQDARGLYLLSTANRQLGDLAGADQAARKLLAADPTSTSGLYALSLVMFDRHEPRQVLDLLTPFAQDLAARAKGRESDAALVLSQLGFAHLQLAAYPAAIDAFTKAKTLDPENPAYAAYLVQAHLSARDHTRAIAVSADALTRFPDDDRLIRLRANALAGADRREDAIKLLESAIAREPDDHVMLMALADLYANAKQFDRAVEILRQAEGKGDENELTLRLGAVFEEAGRVADAEREFRRLIDRDPLNAAALNYLGYMLADRGQRLPEAVALIERALKVDPNNPSYLDSLGWALFKQGKAEEAESHLRKAASALTAQSVIQDHFGDVLDRRGKRDEAIAAWERALSGDGEGIDRSVIERKIKDARGRRR